MLFSGLARAAGIFVLILLGAIIVTLFIGGWPALRHFGPGFLTSTDWDPVQQIFGGAVPIFGTLVTAVVALVLSVPLAFGIAFFLTEMAPEWLRRPIGTAVELLAAVPSIIYGMWGFFVIVPFMANYVEPWVTDTFGDLPLVGDFFSGPPFGTGLLTAAIILAVMIIPFIAATMRDVFLTVPGVFKESAYGLGCTTWEVTFVIGNTNRIATNIFGPGNTIASIVALEFPESPAGSLKLSSLLALGFILFVIAFIVLAISRLLLRPKFKA